MLRCWLRLLTSLRLAPSQTCFCLIFFWLAICVVEFERVNFAPPSVDISCRVFCGISLGLHLVFLVQSQRFNECCKLGESWGLFTRITKKKKRRTRKEDEEEEEEGEEKECITLHNQKTPAGISKSLLRLLPRRWFFPHSWQTIRVLYGFLLFLLVIGWVLDHKLPPDAGLPSGVYASGFWVCTGALPRQQPRWCHPKMDFGFPSLLPLAWLW